VGDYIAGPSHVLPTAGAGRYGSPVGVHTFLRRVSLVTYDERALRGQADDIARLAAIEGLEGHARAVRLRFSSETAAHAGARGKDE
jgi:histidinol dehydrogenase